MLCEMLKIIYNAFVPHEKRAMRHALRYWCIDGGCILFKRY